MYRHNGNALVFDHVSDISRDSFCDKESELHNGSFVHSSTLFCTTLDNSKVFKSNLHNCGIDDSVICGVSASHAAIIRSYVTDAIITKGCYLEDVLIRGHQDDPPVLERVRLSGGVVVDGGVTLEGFSLSGPHYVCDGNWQRAPRTMVIEWESGGSLGITEGWGGMLCVGQRVHPIEQWLRCGRKLANRLHWPEEQVRRVLEFAEELQDVRIEV